MKNLRSRFERFCYQNRDKGIPNLMLYIAVGSAIVYFMSMADRNDLLYYALCFDRTLILQGQVWRLFTYVFAYNAGNVLITLIGLLCYFSLGKAMENLWGTFRFNLFYFTGVILMDVFCMLFGGRADVSYLNMSLFLGYATLGLFPYSLFPLVAIANYFLFFGKDVVNVIPLSWRINAGRVFKKQPKKKTGTVPFPTAGSYQATTAKAKEPYTHKCTICGRTDVSNPELEFRYCSRCNGYHCYCEDHISNHTHIE